MAGKSKTQLEKERKTLLKELKQTDKIFKSTQKARKVSVGQLRAINHQIKKRKKYLSTIQEEVDYYNQQIIQTSDIILGMENDINALKKEYGEMVYQASKKNTSFEKLAFLFSAQSLNQLKLRFKYISMYNASRKKQVKIISDVKNMLIGEQEEIILHKEEKKILLEELIDEEIKLESSKIHQAELVKSLKQDEEKLRKKIKKQKKQQKLLDDLIKKIIDDELKSGPGKTPAADLKKLTKNFASNKGRLPWPTDRGFVSHGFGSQPHPVFGTKSQMNYKGIGIQTNPMQKVKSIFNGEVRMVANIPGSGQLIMIAHGDYISVYNKLKSVYVKKGDIVKTADEIATVNTNGENETELDFQLWKVKKPLNPIVWLKRR